MKVAFRYWCHMYTVLLYYKFTHLSDPKVLADEHQIKCVELGLKGRVFFANEGINGTVSGTPEACALYKSYIESIPEFTGIEWKEDSHNAIPFAKMKTKLKRSICNLGDADGVDVVKNTGYKMSPAEWKKTLDSNDDFLLLDIRNKYEGEVGKFKGAIIPDIDNFHEFPKLADELEAHKEKKILMYCTGGIRCEKFSALLVERGFKDVNQLHGGILTYGKNMGSAHWEGSCFVFDDRLTVPISEERAVSVGKCIFCEKPEDKYLNCANMHCNELYICCDECATVKLGACSQECEIAPGRRPFDKDTFRIPFRKKGLVFPELANKKQKA